MNSKSLLAVVLLLATGIVAWTLTWSSDDAAPPPGSSPDAALPASAASAKVETAAVGDGAVGAGANAAAERTAAPAVAPATAADVGGRVRGRLVDRAGAPRAGVPLSLATWRTVGGLIPGMPAPTRDGRQVDGPEVRSGSDGRFVFPLAAEHAASLSVAADELVFAKEPPTVIAKSGDQDLGDLVVVLGARLAGVVQDGRGQPVEGVKISAHLGVIGFGGTSATTSDAQGRFAVGKLRAGTWHLRTASAKFLPAVQDVELKDEEQRTDLVLVVNAGQAISGQVVNDLGQPVAGCRVGAKRKEARAGVDIERFTGDESTTTDASGFFTLTGLAGETASVRAVGAGHGVAFATDVPVGTGNLLLRVDRLATIAGTLVGTDGKPIAGSRVRALGGRRDAAAIDGDIDLDVMGPDGLPMGGPQARARTAADGSFELANVRPGEVTVVADGEGHRPVRQTGIQIAAAQAIHGVRLVADLGATARVTVLDDAGKPVAGAKVVAQRPSEASTGGPMRVFSRRVEVDDEHGDVRFHGGDSDLGSATTGADGVATLVGLPAGATQFAATHDEFAKARAATVTMPAAGVTEASLTMRRGGAIDVTVRSPDGEPVAAANFVCRGPLGAEETETRGTTDGNGAARLWPLVPGDYVVELRRAPQAHRFGDAQVVIGDDDGGALAGAESRCIVTAGDTTVVDLRRPVLTRVHGVVLGAEGPVAGCQVQLEKGGDDAGMLPPGLGGGMTTTTAGDGTFAFADVESGDYVLRYGRPGAAAQARAELAVAPNQLEQRVDLSLRTGTLRVQAWSQLESAPIAGAEVEIAPAESDNGGAPPRREARVMMISVRADSEEADDTTTMTMGAQRAKTGADGWAELKDVPAGSWTVRVTHKKHVAAERKQQSVLEGQVTDCGRVELSQAGRIRGKVLTADGKAARMALVTHRAVGAAADGQPAQPQPAMGGQFTFDGLAPGKYLLRAQELRMNGDGPAAYGPDVEVEVKPGDTATAELRLAPQ
jgi:uncharacterized GH25 family protein